MSEQVTNSAETKPVGKAPSHIAYSVTEREGKKSKWREIGVVFPHGDGKGFDILYDVIPLFGRITVRMPEEKK
jgi:hypothetical protein